MTHSVKVSDRLAYANKILGQLRFAGLDQNPHGVRDLFGSAEYDMGTLERAVEKGEASPVTLSVRGHAPVPMSIRTEAPVPLAKYEVICNGVVIATYRENDPEHMRRRGDFLVRHIAESVQRLERALGAIAHWEGYKHAD